MKIKILRNLLIIFGLVFALASCGSESSQPSVNNNSQVVVDSGDNGSNPESEPAVLQIDPPAVAPAEAGKASVVGSIYSVTYNQPIIGIPVSLSEIIRDESGEGVYVYDPAFSPITHSLPGGHFVFENVEPGEYVIVVGNVEVNTYKIISTDDGLPQIFMANVDQITDVSEIRVEGLDLYVVAQEQQDGYPAPSAYPEPESDS